MTTTLMITTKSLLDLLNSYKKWSDYRIGKEIGAKNQTVSKWRTNKTVMSDEYVYKVAEILGFDPDWLLLHIHAERNLKQPFYEKLAKLAENETPLEASKKVTEITKNTKN